jgi:hypothetical protein
VKTTGDGILAASTADRAAVRRRHDERHRPAIEIGSASTREVEIGDDVRGIAVLPPPGCSRWRAGRVLVSSTTSDLPKDRASCFPVPARTS